MSDILPYTLTCRGVVSLISVGGFESVQRKRNGPYLRRPRHLCSQPSDKMDGVDESNTSDVFSAARLRLPLFL